LDTKGKVRIIWITSLTSQPPAVHAPVIINSKMLVGMVEEVIVEEAKMAKEREQPIQHFL